MATGNYFIDEMDTVESLALKYYLEHPEIQIVGQKPDMETLKESGALAVAEEIYSELMVSMM